MLHPTFAIPFIWIKSRIDIKENEEILVNYGNEYETLLLDKGGCKCTKCYGEPIEPNVVLKKLIYHLKDFKY